MVGEIAMLKKITSLQHPIVKHLIKLRINSDYRYEHQSAVVEGTKLVHELCAQSKPKMVLSSDETLMPPGINQENGILATQDIINKITGMKNSEGILAEVALPPQMPLDKKKFVIALDEINDPGNMGTLVRTALALGWEGAFILEGSCDPFNEKAVRASRGAIFRLPLVQGGWDALESLIKNNKLHPIAADVHGKDLKKMEQKDNGILLVLGNEAHGLSEKAAQWCEKVTIPMPGPMESLNVAIAGGILMYNLKP